MCHFTISTENLHRGRILDCHQLSSLFLLAMLVKKLLSSNFNLVFHSTGLNDNMLQCLKPKNQENRPTKIEKYAKKLLNTSNNTSIKLLMVVQLYVMPSIMKLLDTLNQRSGDTPDQVVSFNISSSCIQKIPFDYPSQISSSWHQEDNGWQFSLSHLFYCQVEIHN